MEWNDEQLIETWGRYRKEFPDSEWGMEGCGISPSEALDLMAKSIETGHDYLEESFPDYPAGTPYGA